MRVKALKEIYPSGDILNPVKPGQIVDLDEAVAKYYISIKMAEPIDADVEVEQRDLPLDVEEPEKIDLNSDETFQEKTEIIPPETEDLKIIDTDELGNPIEEDEEGETEGEDLDEFDYEDWTVAELKEEILERGLKLPKKQNKKSLIEVLVKDDEQNG